MLVAQAETTLSGFLRHDVPESSFTGRPRVAQSLVQRMSNNPCYPEA